MNNHWFKNILMVCTAVVAMVTLTTGCGGGGGTASGGGGGSATSTLVLQVASVNGRTALLLPHSEPTGVGRVVNAISQLFLSDAWAATAGVEVYLDGILQGSTGVDGRIMFPVTGGVHTIRLVDPSTIDPATGRPVEASFTITVAENSIITIPNITVNNGAITHDTPVLDDDDDGSGGDKTTICHKGKNTLSVGTSAVSAHLAHGDTVGACAGLPGNSNENGSENENENENENGSENENENGSEDENENGKKNS